MCHGDSTIQSAESACVIPCAQKQRLHWWRRIHTEFLCRVEGRATLRLTLVSASYAAKGGPAGPGPKPGAGPSRAWVQVEPRPKPGPSQVWAQAAGPSGAGGLGPSQAEWSRRGTFVRQAWAQAGPSGAGGRHLCAISVTRVSIFRHFSDTFQTRNSDRFFQTGPKIHFPVFLVFRHFFFQTDFSDV